MTTGEKIKTLRTSMNMSQEELAVKIGKKKAAIHKYESGLVENLKRKTIADLARALETTPAYLIGLSDDQEAVDPVDSRIDELLSKATPEEKKALLASMEVWLGKR